MALGCYNVESISACSQYLHEHTTSFWQVLKDSRDKWRKERSAILAPLPSSGTGADPGERSLDKASVETIIKSSVVKAASATTLIDKAIPDCDNSHRESFFYLVVCHALLEGRRGITSATHEWGAHLLGNKVLAVAHASMAERRAAQTIRAALLRG